MQIPPGWKKGNIPLHYEDSIRFTKKVKRGYYEDYFMVDIWSQLAKEEYHVSQTGTITGAKNKSFKTKPAALNYAINIMKYINFGLAKGVLK